MCFRKDDQRKLQDRLGESPEKVSLTVQEKNDKIQQKQEQGWKYSNNNNIMNINTNWHLSTTMPRAFRGLNLFSLLRSSENSWGNWDLQRLSNLYEVPKGWGLGPKAAVSRAMENDDRLDLGVGEDKKECWKRKKLRWVRGYKLSQELFFPLFWFLQQIIYIILYMFHRPLLRHERNLFWFLFKCIVFPTKS